jgi:Tol biopolymer transport system component
MSLRLRLYAIVALACVIGLSSMLAGHSAFSAPSDQSVSATAPGTNGRIAFRRYLDHNRTWGAIFVVNSDGTNARQVTRPPRGTIDDFPDWSPKGSLIVFQRCSPTAPCAVFTVRPDGTGLKRLSTSSELFSNDSGPSFLPDGRRIVFTRGSGGVRAYPGGDQVKRSDLVVMDVNGKNRRVLSRAPLYQADYEYPMFAPDGARLVYEHRRSHFADRLTRRALVVVSANGQRARRLTPWNLNAGDGADWSPDGRRILFRSHEDDDEGTQSQLYVVRPDGSDLTQVTRVSAGTLLLSASFSPDGKWIVYGAAGKNGNADVFAMRADGSGVRPVTKTALWDSAPDWGSG